MLPELDDYNWEEAFAYAPFTREDVAEKVAMVDGENDEANWVGVFKLKDGRYGYLSAGCDYTGWECRASGHGDIRDTLAELLTSVVGLDEQERLGLADAPTKGAGGRE